jgi:hypothetical protein
MVTGAAAQLVDRTTAPNSANAGIAKSYVEQIGAGRGDTMTPDSSAFIIARDPFRSIRRGRQLFQRKFTLGQGLGPRFGDGSGEINNELAIGAGLADSCAACHGRPRGSAGFGGDVATRPDSRDAPHLFGLGLKEMLADEITQDLRLTRRQAIDQARMSGAPVSALLVSKGISFGAITAKPDGSVDTQQVQGVDPDLRVRPFFAHGGTISIREFVVGAFQNEMGLQAVDPELMAAQRGGLFVTPSGMALDGSTDTLEAPVTDDPYADPDHDGIVNEVPVSIVDHMEFYLMNYFRAGVYADTDRARIGRRLIDQIGCTSCHVSTLTIQRDRRVADLSTSYDPVRGGLNSLFATARPLNAAIADGTPFPALKPALGQPFVVENVFSDFKRHDVGPGFYEKNYDGTMRTQFITTPLWGVGSTGPYGHDGRSINLQEVILRHGGEALASRNAFAKLSPNLQQSVIAFLNRLVLFPPDDTASNLDPADPNAPNYPQNGHGSVKLGLLFNDPLDPE